MRISRRQWGKGLASQGKKEYIELHEGDDRVDEAFSELRPGRGFQGGGNNPSSIRSWKKGVGGRRGRHGLFWPKARKKGSRYEGKDK